MYENKLEFPGGRGGGVQNKNLPWGEYGYFLKLHICILILGFEGLIQVGAMHLISYLSLLPTCTRGILLIGIWGKKVTRHYTSCLVTFFPHFLEI